jgi:hypothetical protein
MLCAVANVLFFFSLNIKAADNCRATYVNIHSSEVLQRSVISKYFSYQYPSLHFITSTGWLPVIGCHSLLCIVHPETYDLERWLPILLQQNRWTDRGNI